MKDKFKISILLCIVFIASVYQADAQCAMCKAVVETNLESGGSKGAGLNSGILYLMAFPYLAAVGFGILYYLQRKKSRNSIPE